MQVALKRQQAAEDAIALHLASAESGTTYDYLPPGRIYGMQITSPEIEANDKKSEPSTSPPLSVPEKSPEEVQLSQASIEMLCKLFPNKKRSVLELVLKRCNHDLLKAIEHFNISAGKNDNQQQQQQQQQQLQQEREDKIIEIASAFKPVVNAAKMKSLSANHASSAIPLLTGNKVFMHSLYPFLPLFNPQPVMPSPVYVPSFCECEQCKHNIYARLEARQQM